MTKISRNLHSPKVLGTHCLVGTSKDKPVKKLFIALIKEAEIQSDLLKETRTSSKFIQYALKREQ